MKNSNFLKFCIISIIILVSSIAKSQIPNGSIAHDFTMKDINGNTYNLYSILDSGKTVFIDFFGVLCTPCWQYHQGGVLEQAYAKFGPAGENRLRVFMIECSQAADSQIKGRPPTKGDWTYGTPFPIIYTHPPNIPNIIDYYSGSGLPSYYMICPDKRTISLRPSVTDTSLIHFYMDFCPIEPHDSLFARMYQLDSVKDLSCNNSVSPIVNFQNYGIDTIKNIKTITYINDIPRDTQSFTTNLKKWGIMQLNYNYSDFGDSSYRLKIKTYKINNRTNIINDSLHARFTISLNSENLPFHEDFQDPSFPYNKWGLVQQDYQFPSWEWVNLSYCSAIMLPFGDMDLYNEDYFVLPRFDFTSVAHPLLTFEYAYSKNPTKDLDMIIIGGKNGCDSAWQGLYMLESEKMSTAPDQTGEFIPEPDQWKRYYIELDEVSSNDDVFIRIKGKSRLGNNFFIRDIKIIDSSTSINEYLEILSNLDIYPNPANDILKINFKPELSGNYQIRISNILGENLETYNYKLSSGFSKLIELDVSKLFSGLYFIEIQAKNSIVNRKFCILR